MSLGLSLGLSTLFYTWIAPATAGAATSSSTSWDAFTPALLGSMYFATGLSAILYPGSMGVDPEFGKGFPQAPLFSGLIAMAWLGYWLET